MSLSPRRAWLSLALSVLIVTPAYAQDAAKPDYPKLTELEARFQRQEDDLARSKLNALAELARSTQGDESEAAYRELFDLAVARGLLAEAEEAAREYLTHPRGPHESHALAASVLLLARAGRGDYVQSLADLEKFLRDKAAASLPDERELPPGLAMSVGEAYLQTLIEAGRYDIARRVCEIGESLETDPSVRAHFKARKARLAMVGTPAPAIEGKDIDGRPIRLADLKGKVVLVDFWATWCPPCVGSFATLRELSRKYRDKGLVILGVNLDSLSQPRPGAEIPKAEPAQAQSDVRWFLVSQRARWANLVGPGAEAAATAYGVAEIPARFLIDRDGKIVQVDQRVQALNKAVARALGAKP
ncbi:MAG: TlpA disulfide reductase family protein [Isosphaeraceae bacterium]